VSGPILPTVSQLLLNVVPWVAEKKIIDLRHSSLIADRLLYAENLSEKPFWAKSTIDSLRDSFTKKPTDTPRDLALYVTRDSARQRRVKNEVLITDGLLGFGWKPKVFSPERYQLFEQMALFRSAKLIIGPIGSALFNCVFASPDCRAIVCLVSETYIKGGGDNVLMMRSLAEHMNIPLIFLCATPDDVSYDSDLSLDPRGVDALLNFLVSYAP
jgi:capsular polysaccharide biosynthesis protein